jgi:peptidoglycan/LPS O-acetylase OafA/YrhL
MLACEAVRAGWWRGRAWQWAGGAAMAAACGPLTVWAANPEFQQPWPGLGMALAIGASAAVAYGAALSGPGPLTAVLSWAPLRWLGNISYSFYLTHGLGLHAVAFAARGWTEAPGWLLCVAGFAGATGAALALFLLVEKRWSLPSRAATGGRSSAN